MKTFILNKEVEAALREDPELAIIYMVKFGSYDSDIDPLHNPDYVRSAKKQEAINLKSVRETRELCHNQYPEFFVQSNKG